MKNIKLFLIIVVVLILSGTALVAKSGYFYAKGLIAQYQLERTWKACKEKGMCIKPLNVTDTYPVGKLTIPSVNISRIVLNSATDKSLALGPGHVQGTTQPGETGNVVIAGHRDSFFKNLRNIKVGDMIKLESLKGINPYEVTDVRIVQPSDTQWLESSSEDLITIITCYPFDYIGPAPKRYIVRGRASQV